MNKPELLVPAGDMNSLLQAIHNGCDAVYFGLKNFSARKFSINFTKDEVLDAISLCHLYGVKVYVTMNTLIKDEEVEEFLDNVRFLHRNGVDAILMQDFGMINLCLEMFPNLVVHASTQVNNSNLETIKFLKSIGVKRIVLARELSLDEIKEIPKDIEIEVFIHGALCISYSGNCLMSSMLGGRSGNRGECTGSCRLPYDLYEKNKKIKRGYLLSTKELNTTTRIEELINSNIDSLKIEGRMKSPYYVGFITKYYRNLIDNIPFNKDEYLDNLKSLFNREYTTGNLFNDKIMNIKSPNHLGLEIGKVISISNDKIKIKLSHELRQGDGIRFLNENKGFIVNYLYDCHDNLISRGHDVVYVDNKIKLNSVDTVMLTQNSKLISDLKKYESRKIEVTLKYKAQLNEKLKIILNDGINSIEVDGCFIERAKTSPTIKKRIEEQLLKMGDSPFKVGSIEGVIDKNIFIPIKSINELRRDAIKMLIAKRCENNTEYKEVIPIFKKYKFPDKNILVGTVYNKEQYNTLKELGFDEVYYTQDLEFNYFNSSNKLNTLTNSLGNLQQNVGDYLLNVYNIYSLYYLYKYNLKRVTLSVELDYYEQIKLIKEFTNKFKFNPYIDILVYGRVRNMIIKNNIMDLKANTYDYYLKDKINRKFYIYYDNTNTIILNYEDIMLSKVKENKRFDFYQETPMEIKKIVNKLK